MIKNNLKVVKSDSKKEQELKEKNKALEASISQINENFGKVIKVNIPHILVATVVALD